MRKVSPISRTDAQNAAINQNPNTPALNEVFRKTKINLGNNSHGFGMHSRTLECIANGGFYMIHPSLGDEKPGGIKTEFTLGEHYGEYRPETLAQDLLHYLKSPDKR